MFRSGSTATAASKVSFGRGIVNIQVPGEFQIIHKFNNILNPYLIHSTDTYVGLLRLLVYIYTDTVPVGIDGMLLEDLFAADR
jgi:hypothetical protein